MNYYVRLDVKGTPIPNSIIQRKRKPYTGRWKQLPSADMAGCCGFDDRELASPSPFAATAGAVTKTILNWGVSPNATNYFVERATNAGFSTALTTMYNGPLLTYTATGVGGTMYYYRIVASSTAAYANSPYATTSFVSP